MKLDGVGPVDNRPSTDKLHHIVQKKRRRKKKKIHATHDMLHMVSDMCMLHVTCDTWREVK